MSAITVMSTLIGSCSIPVRKSTVRCVDIEGDDRLAEIEGDDRFSEIEGDDLLAARPTPDTNAFFHLFCFCWSREVGPKQFSPLAAVQSPAPFSMQKLAHR
jgi:hypothetical protein